MTDNELIEECKLFCNAEMPTPNDMLDYLVITRQLSDFVEDRCPGIDQADTRVIAFAYLQRMLAARS